MIEYEVAELLECGDYIIEGIFENLLEAIALKKSLEKEGRRISIFVLEDIEIVDIINE